MRTELVKIIENLLVGNKTKALAYAELLVQNCEKKYGETKDIFDKYEIMGARNIVHMMKGEPKEGGIVVLDSCTRIQEKNNDKEVAELRKCLKEAVETIEAVSNKMGLSEQLKLQPDYKQWIKAIKSEECK